MAGRRDDERPCAPAAAAAGEASVGQDQPLDSRQVRNHAGGFVYKVDDMTRFRRFLIMGSDTGSFYVTKEQLGFENAACLVRLMAGGRGLEAVREIVEVSTKGRAAKQGPGIYALALCARTGDLVVRRAALAALPDVCRTGSTLLEFVRYCQELGEVAGAARGVESPKPRASWGRAMRNAVAGWYLRQSPRDLAYQVTKYGQRQGWSHRDLLRLSHPNPDKAEGLRGAGEKRRRGEDKEEEQGAEQGGKAAKQAGQAEAGVKGEGEDGPGGKQAQGEDAPVAEGEGMEEGDRQTESLQHGASHNRTGPGWLPPSNPHA